MALQREIREFKEFREFRESDHSGDKRPQQKLLSPEVRGTSEAEGVCERVPPRNGNKWQSAGQASLNGKEWHLMAGRKKFR